MRLEPSSELIINEWLTGSGEELQDSRQEER